MLWPRCYGQLIFDLRTNLMKTNFAQYIIATTMLATSLFVAKPALAQQTHGIAAVVNDDVVTNYDLAQRALFMMATQGIQPTEEAKQQILRQALRNLVDEKLEIQEAKKFDQTISEAAIDKGVQTIISRNGISVEEFTKRLAAAGISIQTLRDQVRAEIAWQRIISGLYGRRIRISDAQIDETLNRLTANSDKPSYRVAEIYIEATPDIGGIEGAMKGANAMIEQIKEGVPFKVLARQFSSSASAAKGGDIGWIKSGELRPELDEALAKMEKGQLSPPILVPGGVYVIALIDKQISKSETFYKLAQINYKFSDEKEIPQARLALKKATELAKSCDSLSQDLKDIKGISSQSMGELKSADLTDNVLELLAKTNVGEVSEPITVGNMLVSIMVCDRQVKGSNIPSREQIENRLFAQQEAQASKRHLRNLRRKATIAIR